MELIIYTEAWRLLHGTFSPFWCFQLPLRAWSKCATDHCWGCGAGQLSIRPLRWLYQQGEECKVWVTVQTREELRAQHSDREKCYAAKRKQKCKHGKHPKVPESVLHPHKEPTVNLANKLILWNTVFPNAFGSRITTSCFDHHILSLKFNG